MASSAYAALNREEERKRHMELAGIAPAAEIELTEGLAATPVASH